MDRYIQIKGHIAKDGSLVPFWDSRIKSEYEEEEDNCKLFFDKGTELSQWKTIVFDIAEKTLCRGIEVDIKDPKRAAYKIGEDVYVESNALGVPYKSMYRGKVKEIIFNTKDSSVVGGNNTDKWEKDLIIQHTGSFIEDRLYCVNVWRPSYILESGEVIDYEYRLHKALD